MPAREWRNRGAKERRLCPGRSLRRSRSERSPRDAVRDLAEWTIARRLSRQRRQVRLRRRFGLGFSNRASRCPARGDFAPGRCERALGRRAVLRISRCSATWCSSQNSNCHPRSPRQTPWTRKVPSAQRRDSCQQATRAPKHQPRPMNPRENEPANSSGAPCHLRSQHEWKSATPQLARSSTRAHLHPQTRSWVKSRNGHHCRPAKHSTRREPSLNRHKSFIAQGLPGLAELSLFRLLIRSMNMTGSATVYGAMIRGITGAGRDGAATSYWEGRVALDSDVAQLRRGDLDALATLLTRYQNRLYRYLLRMVRQPAEAEDLFQQTWLRVAEKIQQYDPRRSFEAWLFTRARNLAIDHLRRVRPESLDEPIGDAAQGETAAMRLPSQERPAMEGILQRKRSQRLGAVLEMLPVVQREVLTLRFEEEMKIEEIAEVLSAPLSTVKTRLRRALERLRVILEANYPGESWQ